MVVAFSVTFPESFLVVIPRSSAVTVTEAAEIHPVPQETVPPDLERDVVLIG